LNRLLRIIALSSALLAVLVWAACGKKAEEPATAGETVGEAGAPATSPEDLRGALRAKVAEVDQYMKDHDVTNTKAEEIAAELDGYKKEFEELAAKAGDEELAAQFTTAAEAMEFYVKSLRAPAGDMSSLELAIEAEAKWTEVKAAAAAEPRT
jgi:hypothetical protein